jgi:hypothetical protein
MSNIRCSVFDIQHSFTSFSFRQVHFSLPAVKDDLHTFGQQMHVYTKPVNPVVIRRHFQFSYAKIFPVNKLFTGDNSIPCILQVAGKFVNIQLRFRIEPECNRPRIFRVWIQFPDEFKHSSINFWKWWFHTVSLS